MTRGRVLGIVVFVLIVATGLYFGLPSSIGSPPESRPSSAGGVGGPAGQSLAASPLHQALIASSPVMYDPLVGQPQGELLGGVPAMHAQASGEIGTRCTRDGSGQAVEVPGHPHTGVEIVTVWLHWSPLDDRLAPDQATGATLNHRVDMLGGSVQWLRIYQQALTGSKVGLAIYASDTRNDTIGSLTHSARLDDGRWHEVQVRLSAAEGGVQMALVVDGKQSDAAMLAGATLGVTRRVTLGVCGDWSGAPKYVTIPGPVPYDAGYLTVHTDPATGQFYSKVS